MFANSCLVVSLKMIVSLAYWRDETIKITDIYVETRNELNLVHLIDILAQGFWHQVGTERGQGEDPFEHK